MVVGSHKTEEILRAAKEASVWCGLKWNPNNPRESLRTLDFDYFADSHYRKVDEVILGRRHELKKLRTPIASTLTGGGILVYEPDEDLFDGLSELETDGYLDSNDCPPYDAWIGYVETGNRRCVLSWVPDEIVSLVNAGTDVMCTDCLYWASSSNTDWARSLLS